MQSTHKSNSNALKVTTSTYGIMVGLASVEHGILEVLQGEVVPDDNIFNAIGPNQRFWELASERAYTIILNLLITGILAIIIGFFVILWSIWFLDKKWGVSIFLVLNIFTFLFGGGYGPPISFGLLACITATRINKPLNWWSNNLPENLRKILAPMWRWLLGILVVIFFVSIEIAIFGWPLVPIFEATIAETILWGIALVQIILMPLVIIAAIAHTIEHI